MVSSTSCHLTFNFHPRSLHVIPGLDRKCLDWEGEARPEMRMVFNGYSGWRAREGWVVKLPVGVLWLNHTYFKANSRSFIQLPGSIDVTWAGSIYLPGEFKGEKSMWGLLCRESTLVAE